MNVIAIQRKYEHSYLKNVKLKRKKYSSFLTNSSRLYPISEVMHSVKQFS